MCLGKQMFKKGPLANVINKTHLQEFFNKDFKLGSLDRKLADLNQREKLMLLDWIVDRFMEVDLEKQKVLVSDKTRSKSLHLNWLLILIFQNQVSFPETQWPKESQVVWSGKVQINCGYLWSKIGAQKPNSFYPKCSAWEQTAMIWRRVLQSLKILTPKNLSCRSKSLLPRGKHLCFLTRFRNKKLNKVQITSNVGDQSKALNMKRTIFDKEKERYSAVEINIISSRIKHK